MLNDILNCLLILVHIAALIVWIIRDIFIKTSSITLYKILALGAILRMYNAAFLYLNTWDERFHALVAKNLINKPFKPTLIDDGLILVPYENWWCSEIWLAKPPLALWPVAASINIFGVNEFGLRLPSILFSLVSIYLTYRICRKMFDENTSLLAAFLHSINGLLIMINSGQLSGDHIETVFIVIVQIAMYVSISYIQTKKTRHLYLMGMLMGLAFLCKYTLAGFILINFGTVLLMLKFKLKDVFAASAIILTVSAMVVSPWMVWIYHQFPNETNLMFISLYQPVLETIQGHRGNVFYYVYKSMMHIHEALPLFLIFAAAIIFKSKLLLQHRDSLIILLSYIVTTFFILTLAETKREVYMSAVISSMFILCAFCIYSFKEFNLIRKSKTSYIILFYIIFLGLPIRYCVERIKPFERRLEKPAWRMELEALTQKIDLNNTVLVNEEHYLEARFYYDIKAYHVLNDYDLDRIRNKGFTILSREGSSFIAEEN